MPSEKYVNKTEILEFDKIYHIYNRAVGSEQIFITNTDYYYFQKKFERYLNPFIELYAYCFIPNHFHFLLRIKDKSKIIEELNYKGEEFSHRNINQAFSNFFNSYTKSFNKVHNRMGKLFMLPYKRILVDDESYLITLINYIHRNPIHHGLIKDFPGWKYSSYNDYLTNKVSFVKKDFILSFFNCIDDFIGFHQDNKDRTELKNFYLE